MDGFYKVVLPQLPRALAEVASDSWVLGKQSEFDVTSPQAATLQRDVVKLYTDEYATNWDGFLADLDLPPLTNSQQSVQTLYVLSSPQSPMRDMLTAIVKQLEIDPGTAGRGDRGRRGSGGGERGGRGSQQRDVAVAGAVGRPGHARRTAGKSD